MNGIKECIAAFERLKANTPNNLKFVNIERVKITVSVVSQEAGFDAGYLKSSRDQHKSLIILINDYRLSNPVQKETTIESRKHKHKIKILNDKISLLQKNIENLERINLYLMDFLTTEHPEELRDMLINCELDQLTFKKS